MTQPNAAPSDDRPKGFLGAVERLGNLLPDPVMIFVWLIAGLMVLSALATGLGWQASLAYTGVDVAAVLGLALALGGGALLHGRRPTVCTYPPAPPRRGGAGRSG